MVTRNWDQFDQEAENEGKAIHEKNKVTVHSPSGKKIAAIRQMHAAGQRVHDNRVNGRYMKKAS